MIYYVLYFITWYIYKKTILFLQITLSTTGIPTTVDVYRQPFGIRTVSFNNTQIFINSMPFYCHGVAKHEDSDASACYFFYSIVINVSMYNVHLLSLCEDHMEICSPEANDISLTQGQHLF